MTARSEHPHLATLVERATRAWSDAAEMQVLADELLEQGVLVGVSALEAERLCAWYDANHSPTDDVLYRLEADVREWILKLCDDTFELRVTGGWPDLFFVVHKRGAPLYPAGRARWTFAGVEMQPRLLREVRT